MALEVSCRKELNGGIYICYIIYSTIEVTAS